MSASNETSRPPLAVSRLPWIEASPCEQRVKFWTAESGERTRLERCPHYEACARQHLACRDFFEWAHALRPLVRRNRTPVDARAWLANNEPETAWTFTETGIVPYQGLAA